MTPTTTIDEIRRLAAEILQHDVEALDPSTRIADLGVDSIALVELAIELQVHFGVEFDHGDLDHVETIGSLVRLVDDKR